MRLVVLSSSPWNETSTALCVQLAKAGLAPVGVISLPPVHWTTGMRKVMQWGLPAAMRFVVSKVFGRAGTSSVQNQYLSIAPKCKETRITTINDAARLYGFPIFITRDMNSAPAVKKVKEWRAELLIYTGGGLIRKPMMESAPAGVLNSHIALLPEIRGMSAPEWSLLEGVQPGVTVHFMDTGIDTGPIILRRELHDVPASISDLRKKLVALGVDMLVEAALALEAGTIQSKPQMNLDTFPQYFVMHEKLVRFADARLAAIQRSCPALMSGEM